LVAVVVAVALALRVAAVLLVEVDPRARWSFDMSWYDGVAKRLVAGWGYVGFDWAPTAHWPPGYPLLLAGVYWLFGPSLLAAKLANALLASAAVFLTYRIGCELGRPRVGLVAAAVLALFPGDVLFSPPILSEALFGALFCAVLWAFLRLSNRGDGRATTWLGFGLLLGAATLVRGTALVLLPIFTLTWLARGASLRRAIGHTLAVAVGLAVVLAPWTARNYLRLGYPIVVGTNGINALWVGQSAIATAEQVVPPNPAGRPPSGIELRNPEFEVDTARARTREALAWMIGSPGRVVAMAPAKAYLMYKDDRGAYPWVESGLQRLLRPERRRWLDAAVDGYWLAVLALALVGTRHFLTRERGAVLLPITVAWFTLMHAVLFFGSARFHHPLLPVLSLLVAAELLAWTGRARAAATGKG
jgi:4-amino-4-deoxy-L-arabinose transferase-like glycosyltransferase